MPSPFIAIRGCNKNDKCQFILYLNEKTHYISPNNYIVMNFGHYDSHVSNIRHNARTSHKTVSRSRIEQINYNLGCKFNTSIKNNKNFCNFCLRELRTEEEHNAAGTRGSRHNANEIAPKSRYEKPKNVYEPSMEHNSLELDSNDLNYHKQFSKEANNNYVALENIISETNTLKKEKFAQFKILTKDAKCINDVRSHRLNRHNISAHSQSQDNNHDFQPSNYDNHKFRWEHNEFKFANTNNKTQTKDELKKKHVKHYELLMQSKIYQYQYNTFSVQNTYDEFCNQKSHKLIHAQIDQFSPTQPNIINNNRCHNSLNNADFHKINYDTYSHICPERYVKCLTRNNSIDNSKIQNEKMFANINFDLNTSYTNYNSPKSNSDTRYIIKNKLKTNGSTLLSESSLHHPNLKPSEPMNETVTYSKNLIPGKYASETAMLLDSARNTNIKTYEWCKTDIRNINYDIENKNMDNKLNIAMRQGRGESGKRLTEPLNQCFYGNSLQTTNNTHPNSTFIKANYLRSNNQCNIYGCERYKNHYSSSQGSIPLRNECNHPKATVSCYSSVNMNIRHNEAFQARHYKHNHYRNKTYVRPNLKRRCFGDNRNYITPISDTELITNSQDGFHKNNRHINFDLSNKIQNSKSFPASPRKKEVRSSGSEDLQKMAKQNVNYVKSIKNSTVLALEKILTIDYEYHSPSNPRYIGLRSKILLAASEIFCGSSLIETLKIEHVFDFLPVALISGYSYLRKYLRSIHTKTKGFINTYLACCLLGSKFFQDDYENNYDISQKSMMSNKAIADSETHILTVLKYDLNIQKSEMLQIIDSLNLDGFDQALTPDKIESTDKNALIFVS